MEELMEGCAEETTIVTDEKTEVCETAKDDEGCVEDGEDDVESV